MHGGADSAGLGEFSFVRAQADAQRRRGRRGERAPSFVQSCTPTSRQAQARSSTCCPRSRLTAYSQSEEARKRRASHYKNCMGLHDYIETSYLLAR